MYNDSGGNNLDIIKKSCPGTDPPGWVEGLFPGGFPKGRREFNELTSQDKKRDFVIQFPAWEGGTALSPEQQSFIYYTIWK